MSFVPADYWPPGPPTGAAATDQTARDAAAAAQATASAAMPNTGDALAALLPTAPASAALDYRTPLPATDQRFGFVSDAVEGSAGAMSSGVNPNRLTDPGAPFASVVAGMAIAVEGAGPVNSRLVTTVLSKDSNSQLTLSANAATTVAAAKWTVGTEHAGKYEILAAAQQVSPARRISSRVPAGRYLFTRAPFLPTTGGGWMVGGEQPESSRNGPRYYPSLASGTVFMWRGPSGFLFDWGATASKHQLGFRDFILDCASGLGGLRIGSSGIFTGGVTIEGVTVSGPDQSPWSNYNSGTKVLTRPGSVGLEMHSVFKARVRDNYFVGLDYGIKLRGCDNAHVIDNNIQYCTTSILADYPTGEMSNVMNIIAQNQIEGCHLAGIVVNDVQAALTNNRIEMTAHGGSNATQDLTADLGLTFRTVEGVGYILASSAIAAGVIQPGECAIRLVNPTTGEVAHVMPDVVSGRQITFRNPFMSAQVIGSDGVANGTTTFTGSGFSSANNGKFIGLMDDAGNSHVTTANYVNGTTVTLAVAAPFSGPCFYGIGSDSLNAHDGFRMPYSNAACTAKLVLGTPYVVRGRSSGQSITSTFVSPAYIDAYSSCLIWEKGLGGGYINALDGTSPIIAIANYAAPFSQFDQPQSISLANCSPRVLPRDFNPLFWTTGPKTAQQSFAVYRPTINAADQLDLVKRRFVFTTQSYAYYTGSLSFRTTTATQMLDDFAKTGAPGWVFRVPASVQPRFLLSEMPAILRWSGIKITVLWRPITTTSTAIRYCYFNEVDGSDSGSTLIQASGITSTAFREDSWTETTIPGKWASAARTQGALAGLQLQFTGSDAEVMAFILDEYADTREQQTSADIGNASIVLTPNSAAVQRLGTALTAPRAATLPALNVPNGLEFTLDREGTATGAFNLDIIAKATGSVVFSGQPSDGDTVTVGDGINAAVVFEFDNNSSVTGTNTAVAIGATAAATALAFATAVNAKGAALTVTATLATYGTTILLANNGGLASGNVAVTKSGANIAVAGMAGGGTVNSLAAAGQWATVRNDRGTWRRKAGGTL